MKVYRCCTFDEVESYKEGKKYYKDYKNSGFNTFDYDDDKEYIHFFLFAESAQLYQFCTNFTTFVTEFDIPTSILKSYAGYGWYTCIIKGHFAPLPEFCIPISIFDPKYFKEASHFAKDEWNQAELYEKYLRSIQFRYLINYDSECFPPGISRYSILENSIFDFLRENQVNIDEDIPQKKLSMNN